MVAVLFARADSCYKAIPGCDVWDLERNALNWPGGCPVVAHPPCRAWAGLRHIAKPAAGERELAVWAVAQVRRFGGVLEHPHKSLLWPECGLPAGTAPDAWGGWTLTVDQHWWGHRAQKRTRLYIVGCAPADLPPFPLVLGEASHVVGLWSGRDRARCRPEISKREREATPEAFANWLVALAGSCRAVNPTLSAPPPVNQNSFTPTAAPARRENAVRDAGLVAAPVVLAPAHLPAPLQRLLRLRKPLFYLT